MANYKSLKERVEILHQIVAGTYEDYFNPNTNQGQRGFFETVVGSAIWYLPGGGELFSGKISVEARRLLTRKIHFFKTFKNRLNISITEHSF
jgi:hypothetical protein